MNEIVVLILITAMMGIIGVIFGVAAIVMMVSNRKQKKRCNRETKGTVVEIQKCQMTGAIGEAPMYTWYPVFQYEVNGKEMKERAGYGSPKNKFYIGQNVTVCYNPERYNEFWIKEEKGLGLPGIFLIISVGLLFAGLCTRVAFLLIKEGIS